MAEDESKTAPLRRVMWGRRFLAATVVVPPDVAECLNTDAMAVLAVIRDEARGTGKCTLPVARIAERANIGRTKARAAIRLAEHLGLIAIEETPGNSLAQEHRLFCATQGRSLVRPMLVSRGTNLRLHPCSERRACPTASDFFDHLVGAGQDPSRFDGILVWQTDKKGR